MESLYKEPRLLDQVSTRIRYLHYSPKTEHSYRLWIKRFILFHNKTHPKDMGADEITVFLNYLATKSKVAASTQNQALNAIVFLYKEVLNQDIGNIKPFTYAKRPKRLPTVLSHGEIKRIFENLNGPCLTMVGLMYGSGLRLNESLTLRIMDVDFDRAEIMIRNGKGAKDRVTMLPESVIPGLKYAISKVADFHQIDSNNGIDHIHLPSALLKKYPNAAKELKWKFIFSSANTSIDPVTGKRGRHHLHKRTIERAMNLQLTQLVL